MRKRDRQNKTNIQRQSPRQTQRGRLTDAFPLQLHHQLHHFTIGYIYIPFHYITGHQDARRGRHPIRRALASIPGLRRLQFIRQSALRGPLAAPAVPRHGLHQQRRQPHSLQRHVCQVPSIVQQSPVLWEGHGTTCPNVWDAGIARHLAGGRDATLTSL